jgi:small subunit ribosomal protein S13
MADKENRKGFEEDDREILIRIFGHDIPGSKNVYAGLTRIKGVSWSLSNVVCKKLSLDKRSKILDLDKSQTEKIEDFLSKSEISDFLKNRMNDFETGESKHILSNDLDMKKEFDIKRMKKIKSYKGNRHSFKLPVRGQRTRSNFRRSGIAVGVKRKKK